MSTRRVLEEGMEPYQMFARKSARSFSLVGPNSYPGAGETSTPGWNLDLPNITAAAIRLSVIIIFSARVSVQYMARWRKWNMPIGIGFVFSCDMRQQEWLELGKS